MTLKQTVEQLPSSAGVYQYFNRNDQLLYIGKAKNLSKRVRSYFSFTDGIKAKTNLSLRIQKMINQTTSLNYIVVNTEHDALILENSLIKQLNPKYNILLRDDKTYPYIYLDNSSKYPRLEITRKILKLPNVSYYGPYSIGARDILNSIYEFCKLVQKKSCLNSKKACLYYQINKCLAPCEFSVDEKVYKKELDLALDLLLNKKILLKKLEEKMSLYAQELRFEEAGELRDRIDKIGRSEIKSEIDFASDENYDIFTIQNTTSRAVIVRIFMRHGKIISSSHDFLQLNEGLDYDELFQMALLTFYKEQKPPIVADILISQNFQSIGLVTEYLSNIFDKKAKVIVPKRGKKKHLIDLAMLNANELLKKDTKEINTQILLDLQNLLNLQRVPMRIECFDNSHISGVATVGAMVVYDNGEFDKKTYRTYHLQAKDEYGQMREILTKRVESFSKNSPPDLWVLDGGATLLKLALDILQSNSIFLDVIAISKEKIDIKTHRAKGKANDILYTKDEIFKLKNSDKRLHFIQNLRDEAHRCAINFHKKTKLKQDKESKLLTLKGISQAKIIKLLKHFESFETLKTLTIEDISVVLNQKDAKIIKTIYK